MDRPAAIIRWWGFRDDPSYDDLFRLMTEHTDWVEPWAALDLVHAPDTPWADPDTSDPGRHYPLRDADDAERYLALPMPEIASDVSEYFRLKEQVGDRGVVVAALGNNPGGQVSGLFGSEQFAMMSLTDRDVLHRLMARHQETLLRLIDFLVDRGIGPYFNIFGQEMVAPPLHGRPDFVDFNVRYDRPIADRIHAAGGRLNVHCHGGVKSVIDCFAELGADVFHCFEAPPMGDITPAEAKQALRGKVALEGNIQIGDMYEKSPDEIRAQTEALIRDCFDDRRGLAVTPTASPFMPGRGRDCYPQYAAMVETVVNASCNQTCMGYARTQRSCRRLSRKEANGMREDTLTILSRPWGTMAVREWAGDVPTYLFLHGMGCAADDWELLRPHLPESAQTLAPDYPGHGDSDAPATPFAMAGLVADTLALIEASGLSNLILVGHSLGGMVGIEVAYRSRAVTALVLIEGWTNSAAWSAFAHRDHHYGGLDAAAVAAIEARSRQVRERVPRALLDPFWQSVCSFDGFQMLSRLEIPVTEIYGTAGRREDTMNRLAIPENPHIELRWIEGAGHFLLHERPAEVAGMCHGVRQSIVKGQ